MGLFPCLIYYIQHKTPSHAPLHKLKYATISIRADLKPHEHTLTHFWQNSTFSLCGEFSHSTQVINNSTHMNNSSWAKNIGIILFFSIISWRILSFNCIWFFLQNKMFLVVISLKPKKQVYQRMFFQLQKMKKTECFNRSSCVWIL